MPELPPPEDDGLLIPKVGEWARDKHHFLYRYIYAFTTSMKAKGWTGLHYIDLFASAGIERGKGSGELIWGSPLLAAQAPHPFDMLHLCELKGDRHQALAQRVLGFRPDAQDQVLHGDANAMVHEVLESIPDGSLSLAFLDPHGLHLNFDTVRALADKRTDLIVFFPDLLDALRNWKSVYYGDPKSNLDQVLGEGADWRGVLESTPQDRWAWELRKLYATQISSLGYKEGEPERIYAHGHPLYRLLFFSKKQLGLDLWRRVTRKKRDDQHEFDFGAPP
ncbi:MAG TPA: three-Cys-motif partner protein TcmP [Phycisphaerae bacterium]|nr:three-Cys-motif partner protein TcmP [Phycisphaerae bacterium]